MMMEHKNANNVPIIVLNVLMIPEIVLNAIQILNIIGKEINQKKDVHAKLNIILKIVN